MTAFDFRYRVTGDRVSVHVYADNEYAGQLVLSAAQFEDLEAVRSTWGMGVEIKFTDRPDPRDKISHFKTGKPAKFPLDEDW